MHAKNNPIRDMLILLPGKRQTEGLTNGHTHIVIIVQTKWSCNIVGSNTLKVSKGAKIRNRYNQVPHLTQDTNGKVTNSQ